MLKNSKFNQSDALSVCLSSTLALSLHPYLSLYFPCCIVSYGLLFIPCCYYYSCSCRCFCFFVFVLPLCSAIVSATFFVKQKPSRKNKETGPNRNRVYQGGGVQGWAVQVSGKGKYIEPKAKGRRLTHDKKIKKKKKEREKRRKERDTQRQTKEKAQRAKKKWIYVYR